MPPRPPAIMPGLRLRIKTPFGHLHVTVVVDVPVDQEREVFAQIGHAGDLVAADVEGMCRLASLYLRSGGKMEDVVRQLKGIGTNLARSDKELVSVPDSLGTALKKYMDAKKKHGLKALLTGEAVLEERDEDEKSAVVVPVL